MSTRLEMSAEEYQQLLGLKGAPAHQEVTADQYVEMVRGRRLGSAPAETRTSMALEQFQDWLEHVSPYPVEREAIAIPGRHFRFDWYIPHIRLAFEYDGVKDHGSIKGSERDAMKGNLAQLNDILMMRVNSGSIRNATAYRIAEEAFRFRGVELRKGDPDV